MTDSDLHPIVVAAAGGQLPSWAKVKDERLAHLERVAALLDDWARQLRLGPRDRARWVAAGWLHDALRDAEPASLAGPAAEFPEKVRHGPAAAARLREQGVDDDELLEAIAYHTLGHPAMRRLGRFLFLADYLEPGREFEAAERAALRQRLPDAELEVLRAVCARRIRWRLQHGAPLRPETVDFWNELVSAR